jgi:hypothetical protein
MLVVETIAKIRRPYFAQNKPIKTICRDFRVFRDNALSRVAEGQYGTLNVG